MDPRTRTTIILVSAFSCTVGLLAGYILGLRVPRRDPLIDRVAEIRQAIRAHYDGKIDDEKLQQSTLEGLVSALDRYCEFIPAQEWEQSYSPDIMGEFAGVGIQVQKDDKGFLQILTPLEGSPAIESDILPGDYVMEVDGEAIRGWPMDRIVRRIRGEPGSQVKLKILRDDQDRDVVITRARITINPVRSKFVDDEAKIGYIRISEFSAALTGKNNNFRAAADALLQGGARALVVDLRFNGGGLLNEAVALCDEFIASGTIVTIDGRDPTDDETFPAKAGHSLEALPIVVLINEGTVSASEIYAGCIQDHKRGLLVGESTYGKGLVQRPFELRDGSRLKLTIAKYLTPNGNFFDRDNGKVIKPDVEVKMTREEYAALMRAWSQEAILKAKPGSKPVTAVDKQLDTAIELLRTRINGQ